MKRDRETRLIRVRDPAKMGRSSCSSCSTCSSSSTTSSSCVVGSSSSPPHEDSQQPQLQQKKKPAKRKRPTKPQNHSDESHNANSPTSAARRSSVYRGVTRHRWTGRFEAHLWDKSSWNNTQNKKGRQVYLGAYDSEEAAARTYDLAALKYWGPDTILNFPITAYGRELEQMQNVSKEEYLASLRRCSSGFSRGVSKYRGVARHHHNGRWEARIGRVLGNKYLYLGTYNTQEEAAAAYDMAAIQYRGPNAVTNFDISNYIERLQKNGVHIDLPHSLQQEDHKGTEVEQQSPQVQPKDEEDEEQQHLQEQLVAPDDPQQLLLGCTNDDGRVILSPPSMDSSCVMGPSSIDDHELTPWSFCMDDVVVGGGLDPLPVPDLLIDGRHGEGLPDLFDERGFEDNIDLIFESDDNAFGCGRGHADGDIMIRPEIVVSSEGSTSSPSSSTTSVSCNYTIN